MIVKLLTEHHLEFLSLKGGCRGSSESTHVKMPQCWKSHALAQFFYLCLKYILTQMTMNELAIGYFHLYVEIINKLLTL